MIRACLLLLAGFYAPQLISFDSPSDLVPVAFVASLVAIAVPACRPIAWAIAGGALFTAAATAVVDSRLAPELAGDSIVVDVVVEDFPRLSNNSVAFVARPTADRRIPARIRVSWYEPPVNVRLGDRWRLELRLRRPRGTANPGSFDVEAWLFREAIGAVAYVVGSHRNHLLESGPAGILDTIRQRFVDRVVATMDDPGRAAVLAAIVVGARHLLTTEQWDRYARTGTSHLMAISGLHIGLAASGGYVFACLVLGALRFDGNQHAAAATVALAVAALYALVSGLAIPARRAVVMLGLVAAAMLRRRRPLPVRIVALTSVAIAVLAPLSTMMPGFLLSFGAVVILLWIARRRPAAPSPARFPGVRIIDAGRALARLQLLLLCGLLPMTALLFGRVAFAAAPVNLLAVPLFSFVTVPLALLGFALDGPLREFGDSLLGLAAYGIGLLERVIASVAALDWSALEAPFIDGIAGAFVLLPVCWVLLPPAWPCRALGGLAILALVLHVPGPPAVGCVEARILDVGQGLAVLVRTRNSTLLYDTGPAYRGGGNAAESVILPLLTRLRVARLEHLVITHGDTDHSGGTATILEHVPVSTLYVGEPLHNVDTRQQRCQTGIHWQADSVEFRFLHPRPGTALAGNDASCVLQIDAGGRRLLLTGDIEQRAEASLVQHGLLRPVDVTTVPHHGSRTSSTAPFVAAVRPDVALVANAYGNRWGFPKPEVTARWQDGGARLLQTADSGAIRVHFCNDSGEIQLQRHRVERHRIWHE